MFDLVGKVIALKFEDYKQINFLKNTNNGTRLEEFLRSTFYSRKSFLKLFNEFPVLARVCTVRTIYLINNFSAIIQNINSDYLEIQEFLNVDFLNLTNITLSTGDSHEQGKSVSILYFDEKKLIYKPKNLKISEIFESFIDWYTNVSNHKLLDLKIPKGIFKDDYTYNEFIEPNYCENKREIENYYNRYGYLIAICYLFNLNDLHVENVIAHGEYPVIVDIETSFQVPVQMEDDTLYVKLLRELELESVSSSFLLPTNLSFGMDDKVDLSALSGTMVELNQQILAPVNINMDNFHYEKSPSYFPGGNNIPKNNKSVTVDYKKYLLNIVTGFDEFMKYTQENQLEFIEFLKKFSDKKIRVLVKGTEKYASMIRYSNHPNYNKEMKYRERLMMNLWAYPYKDKRIVNSEVQDLLFNDIPIFYSFPNSRDLIDSRGLVYKDYLPVTGLQKAIDRVKDTSVKSLFDQKLILQSSLGLWDEILNKPVQKKELLFEKQNFNYVKEAINIAELLIGYLIETDDQSTMLSIDCSEDKPWKIVPLDESLYGGLSGIALFFLDIYKITKDEKYFNYYDKIISTAIKQCKATIFSSSFTGWLSPIYPLILEKKYFGTIKDKKFFDYTMEKLSNMTEEQINNMDGMDYISGKAGIVKLLISAYRESKNNENIGLALSKFSNDLIQNIGTGKVSELQNVGLAHGISGIMVVVASLDTFKSEYIREQLAIEYEMFCLREDSYKWCWGISGMIQARLEILKLSPECVDKKELNLLIKRFKNILNQMINEDSLCHGNGSIITTMKMIYMYTQDTEWNSLINLWLSNVSIYSTLQGYSIPKLGDVTIKGLFDGICGIGWLYLYSNFSIENVLLLEV